MATIRNTIDTQFTSRGARGVQQDTENVGRAQTRMGQASAGAGRSFAAQSQGLGGLVGAYAGAAATVFALEAAFTALAKSAQAETIVKGTSALAAGIAQSGPRIIASLQEITQGQLTMAEAAQNANIGLSAGFDSTQIEGLTKVAMGASRALGRNLTDSLQRVFRGVAKLEPELLDELGIFVRIEPAVKAYARELGVAANSLSQFERGQAFANAAIEEGTRKFGMIDVSAPSAQKSLEQLNTQVMELALEFGQLLTQILLPFVNFLKNDAGNALVLFGGIILLVFSKALTMIGAFASGGITKFTTFADSFIANTASMRAAIEALNISQQRYMATLGKGGLTGMTGALPVGTAARADQLKNMGFAPGSGTTDKTGRFDSVAGRKDGAAGASTAAMRTAATKARNDFIAGNLKTKQSVEIATGALTRMNATLKSTSMASQQATAIITALAGATTQMGRAATLASGALALLKKGVVGLGVLMSGLMGLFSTVFLVLSVAELAGANVFGKIKDYFVDSSQAAANFESAITGAFTAMQGGSGKLTIALRGLGATDEDLEKLSETMVDINKDLLNIQAGKQADANRTPLKQVQDRSSELVTSRSGFATGLVNATSEADAQRMAQTALTQFQDERSSLVTTTTDSMGNTIEQAIPGSEEYVRQLDTTIDFLQQATDVTQFAADQQAVLNNATKLGVIAEEEYQKQLQLVTAAGEAATYIERERLKVLDSARQLYKSLDESILPVIGSLGRLTGIRMDELTNMFMGVESEISASAESLKIFGIEIPKVLNQNTNKMEYNFEALSEETRELAESSVIVSNAVREANKAFDAGATSSDKLSSVIAGASAQFLNNKANIAAYAEEIRQASGPHDALRMSIDDAKIEAAAFFDVLKSRVRDLIKLRDELKKVEATYKGLVKTFKSESAIAENLRFSGAVSEYNQRANQFNQADSRDKIPKDEQSGAVSMLARSAMQQKEAQMDLLGQIIKTGNEYEAAEAKVKKYEDALDAAAKAGSTYDQAPIGAPNAVDIQKAEALTEAQNAALGILIEQGLALSEINDKFDQQQTIVEMTHLVQLANLAVMQKQADVAAANSAAQGVQSLASAKVGVISARIQLNKTNLARADLDLQERISVIQHNAAMAQAKGNGSSRAAHLLKMNELKNEFKIQQATAKLTELERKPFTQFAQIKKARLEIINMEKEALKENFKFRMAAIKAQAGASKAAAQAEVDIIKENLAAARAQITPGQDISTYSGYDRQAFGREQMYSFPSEVMGPISELQTVNQADRDFRRQQFGLEKDAQSAKVLHDVKMAQAAVDIQELEDKRVTAQRTLADEQLKAQRDIEDANFKFLDIFLQAIDGFTGSVTTFAEAINKNLEAEGKDRIPDSDARDIVKDARARIETFQGNRGTARSTEDANIAEVRSTEDEISGVRLQMLRDALSTSYDLQTQESQRQSVQTSNFIAQMDLEIRRDELKVKQLARDLLAAEAAASSGGLETQMALTEAQAEFDNGMASLTTKFNQADSALGKFDTDIGAISDVIEDGLITAFSDLGDILLGLGDETKSFGEQVSDVFRSFMMSIIKEIQMQMIVKPLAGAASGFISGLFQMASGGSVRHMADGGQVNALRDRVPAMLEPGEFVIRKNSAKSIGRNKLGQMNATGSAGMGNVQFNIVNEGAAKQAEQQGPPKIDTDKIVIDVVMRDLANNGPIRKALRNG